MFKPGSEPLKMLSNKPKLMLPASLLGPRLEEARRLPPRRRPLHSLPPCPSDG
jgi:hypothetical protein